MAALPKLGFWSDFPIQPGAKQSKTPITLQINPKGKVADSTKLLRLFWPRLFSGSLLNARRRLD
jgi:hypothetical protein